MGAIAESMLAYAQPLLDQTDGSEVQVKNAIMFSAACFNIGILPESERAESVKALQSCLKLSDEHFEVFCNSIVYPMLVRFDEMFPNMSGGLMNCIQAASTPSRARLIPTVDEPTTRSVEPLPYAPCPCTSGKKYKFCCKHSKALAGVH